MDHVDVDAADASLDDTCNSLGHLPCDNEEPETKKPDTPLDGLSKRQRKRLVRKEKWILEKSGRRSQERQRKKERRQAAVERGEHPAKRRKHFDMTMEKSSCRVRVAIDVSFDHLMDDKDVAKTCKQLMRCYATNRRSPSPMQLCISSFADKTKIEMMSKHNCKSWDLNFYDKSYFEVFNKDDIVYLTSESPNVLEKLDDTKVYIIGGFVDHNKHKGLCFSLAQEKDICHARLPIEQYLTMSTRKVLAINHVFEILLKVAEGLTWANALMEVMPQRKGAEVKDENKIEDEESEDSS